MTTQGDREANYMGLQCPEDQCRILGQMESSICSQKPSPETLAKRVGLVHMRQGHAPSNPNTISPMKQKSLQGGGSPKRRCLPQPKRTTQEQKKKRSPEATSLLQPRNPKEPKTKGQERPSNQMLQELFYSTPRNVVITNEEEASLYRIWEGLV